MVPERAAAFISCASSIPPEPEVPFFTLTDRIFECRTQARTERARAVRHETQHSTCAAVSVKTSGRLATRSTLFPSCSAPCWRSRFVVVLVSALRVPLALHACPSSVSCLTGRVVGELRALGLYVVAGVVELLALFLLCQGSHVLRFIFVFFFEFFLRLSHRL